MNLYDTTGNYSSNVDRIFIYSYTLNKVIIFPAFLTDISDVRNCNWGSTDIYGKMDSVYIYKNTTRKITLSFDIPCYDFTDSWFYTENLRGLRQSIYPIYKERTVTETNATNGKTTEIKGEGLYVMSSPPYHRIRYCNLIKSNTNYSFSAPVLGFEENPRNEVISSGLLGFLEGFTFTPKLESGFFVSQEKNQKFAKVFSVNLSMNVVHETLLGFKQDGTRRTTRENLTSSLASNNLKPVSPILESTKK